MEDTQTDSPEQSWGEEVKDHNWTGELCTRKEK